jgi:hypothetical protein
MTRTRIAIASAALAFLATPAFADVERRGTPSGAYEFNQQVRNQVIQRESSNDRAPVRQQERFQSPDPSHFTRPVSPQN